MRFFGRGEKSHENFQPETETGHLEVETRLPDVQPNFESLLLENGAELEVPKRLIQDTRYKIGGQDKKFELEIPKDSLLHTTPEDEFVKALEYSGFLLENPGLESVFYIKGFSNPKHDLLVRIRKDNRANNPRIIYTVKGPKEVKGDKKIRPEYEAAFNTPVSLEKVLQAAEFGPDSYFEKNRTTLQLLGCKIEVDETPIAGLGRWAEIEGPEAKIDEAFKKICEITGYQGKPLAIGQREFIKNEVNRLALPKINLKNIKF